MGMLGATLLPVVGCDHDARSSDPDVQNSAVAARFPGAGKGGAGLPIAAGTVVVSCEQPGPLPAGSTGPAPGAVAVRECYFDADHPDDPAAIMEWVVESAAEGDLVHARLSFNPRFVDNSYGDNAIGWSTAAAPAKPGAKPPKPGKGHTFKDLVGSDHAEFTLADANGSVPLKFKADYLSEDDSALSGYSSQGVWGGEGKMLTGSADEVVAVSTSLDRNLNRCGYEKDYFVNSPATDANYSVNPAAPNWDFRVVYDVWVKQSAFGAPGFGRASVEFVHASPSKAGKSTIEVVQRDCPPGWPPYCTTPGGCGETPPICGDEPDENCTPACVGENCPQPPVTTDAGVGTVI
jgi:hypothetical protein